MAFHQWVIAEVYSNSTGNVQFITLFCPAPFNGENVLDNHTIKFRFTGSVDSEVYTIPTPDGFDGATAGKALLFATQDFANLGLLKPDFIIPDRFLGIEGTLNVFENTDTLTWELLPTDGFLALNGLGNPTGNRPRNYAGDEVEIPRHTSVGGNTADYLTGTDDSEFMVGNGGNDVMNGGSGGDIMNGGSGADTMNGGEGADKLNGGAGTDRIQGEAGNDKLTWGKGDFFDGGANTDTLKVGVASLDLTTAANSNNKLLNIEQIDLKAGAHTLTLNRSDVLAMSPTDTVKILGGSGDTVNFVGAEIEGGAAPDGFTRYTINGAVLIVDSDINVI